jgi:hypothetical protein
VRTPMQRERLVEPTPPHAQTVAGRVWPCPAQLRTPALGHEEATAYSHPSTHQNHAWEGEGAGGSHVVGWAPGTSLLYWAARLAGAGGGGEGRGGWSRQARGSGMCEIQWAHKHT